MYSLDPHFRFADGKTLHEIKSEKFINSSKHGMIRINGPALSEAERNRLVRAAKSRTANESPPKARIERDLSTFEPIIEIDEKSLEPTVELERRSGQFTRIQERDWSGEIRIRTYVETPLAVPPQQSGDRVSEMLSDRGGRKIADSCHYMALKKGGYRTFITGTFSPEARARIKRRYARPKTWEDASGKHTPICFDDGLFIPIEYVYESTVQAEVSRCMDAIKKMYLRGWEKKNGERVPSTAPVIGKRKVGKYRKGRQGDYIEINYERESLCYCWVVEVPKNEEGEDNPHVHILMNWQVPYDQWDDWRERLEAIWANGYFHLEKLKSPEYAGAYMAKAAGYLSKGNDDNSQGLVRGNRYSISQPAIAPDWCTVGEYEMGVMGRLLAEINDHVTHKYGDLYAKRKHLNKALENTPKKYKRLRSQIGQQLAKVRQEVNRLPIRASKFQLVIKTKEYFSRFWGWAQGKGWSALGRPTRQFYAEFSRRSYLRKKKRELNARKSWCDEEWTKARAEYAEWPDHKEPEGVVWGEYDTLPPP
ncbi:MAG: hypothetical protein K9K86_11915 [Pseudomonadales bacterium]|nr:hypothetical protein [Pseudomonadales bacterium]